MSIRQRHPAAWLLCAVLVGGCAQPLSPYERAERDRQTLDADVRGLVEKAVAEANARAAKTSGAAWVDIGQFSRVVFFVPRPAIRFGEPMPPIEMDAELVIPMSLTPPEGAVRRQWTDRCALAQRFVYRYVVGRISISQGPDLDVPYVATVRVRLEGEHQTALAVDARPIPEPPAGMQFWRPFRPVRGFFGYRGTRPLLPDISVPGQRADEVEDPLAVQAVEMLKTAETSKLSADLEMTVTFVARARRWLLAVKGGPLLPAPRRLTWSDGVEESSAVLNPSWLSTDSQTDSQGPSSRDVKEPQTP